MPFEASTSLFSVGSPFTKYFDPQGACAATDAPALLRSSPTTKSTAKFLTPSPSSFSAASTIAAMIPFASHAPRPQHIEPAGFDFHPLGAPIGARGELREMVVEIRRDRALVFGDCRDIHQRSSQLVRIHRLPALGMERNENG